MSDESRWRDDARHRRWSDDRFRRGGEDRRGGRERSRGSFSGYGGSGGSPRGDNYGGQAGYALDADYGHPEARYRGPYGEGDEGRGEHRGRGPRNYRRSDQRIHEDVNDRLTDDPWLDASDMEVGVSDGEVTLSGTVRSRHDKRRAEHIAESAAGVRHVQNNLRVSEGG